MFVLEPVMILFDSFFLYVLYKFMLILTQFTVKYIDTNILHLLVSYRPTCIFLIKGWYTPKTISMLSIWRKHMVVKGSS